MKIHTFKKYAVAVVVVAAFIFLSGCGAYVLRGKVVQGPISSIEIVHELDSRLNQPGLADAVVYLHRDPGTLNRHQVGRNRSGGGGQFAMRLNEFGAGWMEEDWLVQCRLIGYTNAEARVRLPSKRNRSHLLITLSEGVATPIPEPDELRREVDEYR